MAPVNGSIRKAFDLLKDQTSISIARVTGAGTPDLEVAIVKATSHDKAPPDERHMQAILQLTSFSRAYVSACVCYIERRLGKTRNWVVAIKSLILAHRLLRDGDPAFEKEFMLSRRRGSHILNVTDFSDESHARSWDFSNFVHAYGLYLDDRLECSSSGSFGVRPKSRRTASLKGSKYDYSDSAHHRDGHDRSYDASEMKTLEKERSRSFKDMKLSELMDVLPAFQRLLGRVLACKPMGRAKLDRLVNVALYAVIRESFVLYTDLQEGMDSLHGAFFDMDWNDHGRVLDMYNRGAKQMNALDAFYSFCKALGVCKTTPYPNIKLIPEDVLLEMEDFVRNPGRGKQDKCNPKVMPPSPPDKSKRYMNKTDSIPTDLEESEARTMQTGTLNTSSNGNATSNGLLVNTEGRRSSSEDVVQNLPLALFPGVEVNTEPKWEAFKEEPPEVLPLTASRNGLTGWELAVVEPESNNLNQNGNVLHTSTSGLTGWELALVESESEFAKPNNMAIGYDNLLLESLYEQGGIQQNQHQTMGPAGSESHNNSIDNSQSDVLPHPAPPSRMASLSTDFFAASEAVACPANFRTSEMQRQQQLLVRGQQQWLQYQHGMQSHVAHTKHTTNPFLSPFQPISQPVPYHLTNPYHS